jgi:hypothetical protein
MKKSFLMIIAFSLILFIGFAYSIAAEKATNSEPTNVKAQKNEPFLWDLIFSSSKTIIPMVSTSTEIALSPTSPGFRPNTQMMANQKRYTTNDRVLIQNHLWNEGDQSGDCDYYLAFIDLNNPQFVYWFSGTSWGSGTAVHQFLKMGVGFDKTDTILDLRLSFNPPVGRYKFAAGLAYSGTANFYQISTVDIEIY